MSATMESFEHGQPWVIYVYGRTVDTWWPPWRSTRVLGYAEIECQCCICGDRTVLRIPIPRFGPIVDRGPHPLRQQYLERHRHPMQTTAPETWVWPLRNPAAHGDTLDILRDVANKAASMRRAMPAPDRKGEDDAS